MSAAFDLTPPVSLPELDEGAGPANGPGPALPSWQHAPSLRGEGSDACEPPIRTRYAPPSVPASTGRGDVAARDERPPACPSGEPYPGNLLADILEYRRMRARVLAGATLPQAQEARYGDLQLLLCAHEPGVPGRGRAYHRFDIRVPALLRVSEGRSVRSLEIGVDNISAGGVKLVGAEARTDGERVELLMDAGSGRVVVLPARVAWARGRSIGLMFAGAARWQ